MKKIFISALAIAALFTACQREEFAEPIYDGDFYASVEEFTPTRTHMDESRQVLWSDDDRIVIFNKSNQGVQYKVKSGGKTTASFTKIESDDFMSPSPLAHVVSYYPYSDMIECDKASKGYLLTVVLPSEQEYSVNSFGKGALPMAAISEDANLAFKNVSGAMRLQLKGTAKVTYVKVEGKNNEKLSGAATVTVYIDGTTPSIEMESDAYASVTLDCGDGVQLSKDEATDFIISLPPVKFTKGFTVTITDASGVVYTVDSNKSTNEIIRSSILKMPEMTLGVSHREPMEGDYIDEYGVNHGQGVDVDGVVWAPVNCGYHETDYKYGKLYQWGRKYGQGYKTSYDASACIAVEGPVSLQIGQSKDNEAYFYMNAKTSASDWLIKSESRLWNLNYEGSPIKSEYDPCPDGWRVPTDIEMNNLKSNKSGWTTENGQNGYWFSGSQNYSSSVPSIFLPASGSLHGGHAGAYDRGVQGAYWTSYYGSYPIQLRFTSSEVKTNLYYPEYGFSVRCVKYDGELISVSSVTLDEKSLSLIVNDSYALSATITPSNANHQKAFWWSSDDAVATVDHNGKVTAVKAGTATITAMAGMQTTTCEVTVEEKVEYIDENGISRGYGVKIDDVIWAPVNCGYHETDFKYGKLYQWGRKYGQGYDDRDASSPEIFEGPVSLAEGQSESNKNYFYKNSSSPNDWLYVPDITLWNTGTEENPIKTEYDPCPDGWRVPTGKELSSVISHKSPWATENDQEGYWFSGSQEYSAAAPQVFFPAAGRYHHNGGYSGDGRGDYCYYWASTSGTNMANALYFYYTSVLVGYSAHADGYSVRCVKYDGPMVEVSYVTLNTDSVMLGEGRSYELSASIAPSNANHQKAFWWSSDDAVATVDQNGKVTAVKTGTATITAMAGMQTATCEVTVRKELKDYVDEYGENHGSGTMIDGTIWAPVNCGYKKPNSSSKGFPYGKLYQWGRRYGQGYSSEYDELTPIVQSGPVSLENGQSQDYEQYFFTSVVEDTKYDWLSPQNSQLWNSATEDSPQRTEYDPCPEGWRVPSYEELEKLVANRSIWTTGPSGVDGYWFSGSQSDLTSSAKVFFPAGGYLGDFKGDGWGREENGYYWSSKPSLTYAYCLNFNSSSVEMVNWGGRAFAFSIRCVQE